MSTTTKIIPVKWNLAQIWNACAFKENRPLVKRDYVYASELGSPLCDRFLKMNAVAYTNPPNNRSLRKFLAGNLLEYIVKIILIASGVYKHDEIKADGTPYDDCLSVHGRLDFKCGSYIDGAESIARLNEINLPDYLYIIGKKIIEELDGKHLEEVILELKGVSTFAMDKVERMGAAIPNHTLQGYHYQKHKGIPANIVYCCKDDCRMAQFGIDAKQAEVLYKADLQQMTYYFKKKKQPPVEPLAKFDDTLGRFSKNLGVEYSPYLTKLYGFETPEAYRESVGFVEKWNRTLARYFMVETGATTPTGKLITITDKNKECRVDIERAGYKLHELIECKINLGITSEEETE
jgi:hypothetical protein